MTPRSRTAAALTGIVVSATLVHATDYTVPGPGGESLKFYLESPLSPVVPGDTLILTEAGNYQTTYIVSDANLTIRAGDGQSIVIDGQFVGTVFTIQANNITFEGLTIRNGFAAADGGGIYSNGFDVTARDCRFEANAAGDDAGAFFMQDAVFLVEDCEFVGNETLNMTADSWGGAIQNVRGDITLRRCLFEGNDGADGAGAISIADTDARFRIEGCVFRGNTAPLAGAIWWNSGAEGDVFDSTFDGNVSSGNAGAVYHNGSPATYTRCVFTGNSAAGDDGGAIFINGETTNEVVMTSCLIAGNTAASSGAGVFIRIGPDPTFLNCTIVDNTALGSGGGVATEGAGASGFFRNCIVRGNSPAAQFAGPAALFNSNVQGGGAGTNVIDVDPLFVDAPAGDYRLAEGSPSIDAGDANFYSAAPAPLDLDAAPRAVTASDAPTGLPLLGLYVDQGAFEFQPGIGPAMPGCNVADLAEPYDVLDFSDVLGFLGAFGAGCP